MIGPLPLHERIEGALQLSDFTIRQLAKMLSVPWTNVYQHMLRLAEAERVITVGREQGGNGSPSDRWHLIKRST